MAIDRKAYKEAKKSYRATKKSNKAAKKWDEKGYDRYVKKEKKKYTKASLKQEKSYRKTEKKKGLEEGSIVGALPPFKKPYKVNYDREPEIKPIRSDYKIGPSMVGQERLNRLESKIDTINENVQGTTPANPQAPAPDPQMDPSSNGTGSARPVFTQQTANDLEQINKGDAMSNVLFNQQQGASMKIDPPKADNTRVKLPTGFKSNKQLKGERSVKEHIDLAKSSMSDYAGYRSGDARNFKMISKNIKEHIKG